MLDRRQQSKNPLQSLKLPELFSVFTGLLAAGCGLQPPQINGPVPEQPTAERAISSIRQLGSGVAFKMQINVLNAGSEVQDSILVHRSAGGGAPSQSSLPITLFAYQAEDGSGAKFELRSENKLQPGKQMLVVMGRNNIESFLASQDGKAPLVYVASPIFDGQ